MDNGTVIKQLKLYTANEQTVNIDIANRKRVYELGNSDLPEYYTLISILLTICSTVNVTRYRVLIDNSQNKTTDALMLKLFST